jgi:simple sugar transport system ATP-binding protein
LADCLSGIRKPISGKIEIDGKDITNSTVGQRVKSGLAHIAEERMRDGSIRDFSVEENLYLQDHSLPEYTNGIFLNFRKMKENANKLIKEFSVKTPSLDTPIKNLSGGNIQKLIMARELSRQPKALIAAQPTRGLDIGATEYIHKRLLMQRDQGSATLLISEDLEEIRALSDRIAVIYEGRIIGIVSRGEATVEQIGLMMAGISKEDAMQQAHE